MALDLNAVKNRLAQLQSKGKKKNADGTFEKTDYTKYYYKVKLGEQTVRIVPFKNNPSYPFLTVEYHNDIVKKKMLALTNFGEKDPIVEFSLELRDSINKEDKDLGWKLKPKSRIFAQVLVRGEEHLGVRLWEFGSTVEEDLIKLISNKNYGDITDVNQGTDLTITGVNASFSNGSGKSTNYIKPSIVPERAITALADTEEDINRYLTEQHDPLNLPFQKKYTYQEILGFLAKWLNPEEEDQTSTSDEAKPTQLGNEVGDSLAVSAEPSDDLDEVFIEDAEVIDEEPPFDIDPVKPISALKAASNRVVAQNNKEIAAAAKTVKDQPTVPKTPGRPKVKKEEPKTEEKAVAKAEVKTAPAGSNKDKFNALFGKK